MRLNLAFAGACLLGLTACISACTTPTTPSPTGQAAISAGITLASVAAANNTTAASLIGKGQIICNDGGALFSLAGSLLSPATVAGQAAADVAQACKAISAVAVPQALPAGVNPAAVPVVIAPAAVAALQPPAT
jgi:hypothetical protein